MKYRVMLVLIITVIMFSLTGCVESKAKEFQDNVDKFCANYDKLIATDDPLYKDIALKGCLYALDEMAELYENSGLQKSYNDYMKRKISYYAVEVVLEYDEEDGNNMILRGQLIEYLKENQ